MGRGRGSEKGTYPISVIQHLLPADDIKLRKDGKYRKIGFLLVLRGLNKIEEKEIVCVSVTDEAPPWVCFAACHFVTLC